MAGLRGDFIGFTFDGKHSADMGITRVSDGNRYNDNLLPAMQDKTVVAPGADGTYFFKTNYTTKSFNINFAFDTLTESEYRNLRQWLGDKKPHDLIFDEAPYKVYKAKVTGNATIKTICFDEENENTQQNERIYKGEGTIQFTAYNPYARSQYKTVEEYESYSNVDEWIATSGIKSETEISDIYDDGIEGFKIYNPGDIETDFIIRIPVKERKVPAGKIAMGSSKQLEWESFTLNSPEIGIMINTKLNLIQGYTTFLKAGTTIYNSHILGGSFFKLPIITDAEFQEELTLVNTKSNEDEFSTLNPTIEYDYLYF